MYFALVEAFYIALKNQNDVECHSAGCDGQLQWENGGTFQYESFHSAFDISMQGNYNTLMLIQH